MRALVVYIALFLAVEVFHCDGEQNWEKWFSSNDTSEETDCTFQNYSIPNNETRNLTDPCIDVMCTTGVLIVLRSCEEDKVNKTDGETYPGCCERLRC
uniref:Putative conserved secreted protein n=1 Tax=Amblyomma tuberculatum TaxID=48802 RepID=A0A6M2E480_9ACAR